MAINNLLFKRECAITPHISVIVPTVGEILEDEDNYNLVTALLTAMPIDMMVELDDVGIDFSTIDEYYLFILFFDILKNLDTSLVFGDLDLKKFHKGINENTREWIVRDPNSGAIIDRIVHGQIADTLRKILHHEKNLRKPGNEEARKYMIERARKKRLRNRGRKQDSQLEQLIVALVNTSEFHYGFEGIRELSIYQFNESLRQILKKVEFDNRMIGVYAGTVNAKELSQDDLNWLSHK